MTINPHNITGKAYRRGQGPDRNAKIVVPYSAENLSDFPAPTVAGEVRVMRPAEANLRAETSQFAKMFVAVEIESLGTTTLQWVRVSAITSGLDSRTGKAWNHLRGISGR